MWIWEKTKRTGLSCKITSIMNHLLLVVFVRVLFEYYNWIKICIFIKFIQFISCFPRPQHHANHGYFIFGSPSSKIVLAPFSFSTWGSKAKRGRLTCQRSHPRHWPKPVVLSACVATITFVSLGLELLQQGKPSSFDTTDAPKNTNKVKGLLNWCFSH